MGGNVSVILVGGIKRGKGEGEGLMFCGSSVEGTCQGWSIFP